MTKYLKIFIRFHFAILYLIFFYSCSKHNSFEEAEGNYSNYEEKLTALVKQAEELSRYSNPDEFIGIYKNAIPLLENYTDTTFEIANLRNFFIQRLSDVGMYEQAIKQSYQGLEANRISSFEDSIRNNLMIYGKLVSINEKIEKVDSVFSICQIAVICSQKHPDPQWLSSALNNAGFYFHKYGNNESAMDFYQRADSILSALPKIEEDWHSFRGSLKDNMAEIYEEQGEFEKARDIYDANFKHWLKNRTNYSKWIDAGISLIGTEIELSNYIRAGNLIKQLETSINSLKYEDKTQNLIDFLGVKIKYYNETGNVENGFEASKRLLALRDSLNIIEVYFSNQTLNTLASFTSNQFEVALQQETEARQLFEQRAKLRLWIIFLVVLGSVIATLSLIKYQRQKVKLLETDKLLSHEKLKRNRQKQELLSLQLDNKKKDLTDMAISLHHKQQWARKLNDQMKKVSSGRGYKRSRELKKLQEEIRGNVFVDKNLELIQQNIQILSHDFYDNLKENFPTLTKSENKLCSYIKLNLNTTQIAQLQNIDPSSVKMGRYRLKKKLNLDPEQNLDTFIQNFDN